MLINTSYVGSDIELKSDIKPNSSNPDKIPDGTVIKGEIVDLKKDEVTIKTELGQLIKAQLAREVEAMIGQIRSFSVLKSLDNNMILEMKPINSELMKQSVIHDALMSAGFKNTDENIKLALTLLDNRLSLDKETLTKFNQLGKLLGSDNIDKALFFVENDIKPTAKNVQTFNSFLQSHIKLNEQIEALAQNIGKLTDFSTKENLKEILINGERLVPNKIDRSALSQKSQLIDIESNKMIETNKNLEVSKEVLKDKIAELLKNNMTTKEEVIKLIQDNVQGEKSLPLKTLDINNVLKQIFSENSHENVVLKRVMGMPEKSDLKEIVKEQAEENSTAKKIMSKLNFDPVDKTPKQLEQFINELKCNIELAKTEILKGDIKPYETILSNINDIDDNLSFISQIKNNVFLQIPLNINGQQANGELFVFKDKKKNKGNNTSVSALVALDTLSLGRFEVYLQKNNKDVSCQFRVKDEKIESLVIKNIQSLNKLFNQYNYSISSYSFRRLDEPFTFIDKEPTSDTKKEQELLRYTFDLRA